MATAKKTTVKKTEVKEKTKKAPKGRIKGEIASYYIEIDEDYRVKYDIRNFMLQLKTVATPTEDGDDEEDEGKEDGWKTLGYYSNMTGVMQSLVKSKHINLLKLNKKQTVTFEEYYKALCKCSQEVIDLVKPVVEKFEKIKGLN